MINFARSMPSISRRSLLAGSAASLMLPRAGRAALDSNPDIVIVGAGAAGIAAAHTLTEQGVRYVMIEAGSRIGGRAYTETETFGVPFDHGAHWVQSETRNPYFERAQQSPYRFYRAPDNYRVFDAQGEADSDALAVLWRTWENVEEAMGEAAEKGWDVAPSTVASDSGAWARTAWFGIGPWEMGKDMDEFSCLDWWNSADSIDWYCAAGYGRLVTDHGTDLPVALDTAATRMTWDGTGVTVETNRGTIRARAVILTVSTGVLASGDIIFDPALPVSMQEAIHGIPMGDYNHIALHFSEDIFGMGEDGYLLHQVDESMEAFGALTNASGSGLAYCDVGGSFARELEAAGEQASIDFVMKKLRAMLGSDVDRTFRKGAVTAWRSDPLFRGCYASATFGAYVMRRVLREPIGDRIFLAGEACHPELWATVGGAALSGAEVAAETAAMLS